MKKLFALIVMAMLVTGLTGCIDGQDDNSGKLPTKTTQNN